MRSLVKTSALFIILLAVLFTIDITSVGPAARHVAQEIDAPKEIKQIAHFPLSFSVSLLFFLTSMVLYLKDLLKNKEEMLGIAMPVAGYLMFCGVIHGYLKTGVTGSFLILLSGVAIFIVGGTALQHSIEMDRNLKVSKKTLSNFSAIVVITTAGILFLVFLLFR